MVAYVYDLSGAELAQVEGGISSWQFGTGICRPTESVTLNFTKVEF
jgi:hypothetical protein